MQTLLEIFEAVGSESSCCCGAEAVDAGRSKALANTGRYSKASLTEPLHSVAVGQGRGERSCMSACLRERRALGPRARVDGGSRLPGVDVWQRKILGFCPGPRAKAGVCVMEQCWHFEWHTRDAN